MKKNQIVLLLIFVIPLSLFAQKKEKYELNAGVLLQKTQHLYWENGVGLDYTADFLLQKRIHFKAGYVSSRLGSAMIGKAIKQDNFVLGADWRFRSEEDLQILAGLNTGFFTSDFEADEFDVLPNNSMLFSVEAGIAYKFKFPVTATLSAGYNLINGNGIDVPGNIFPVFYRLSVFYNIGNLMRK
jgi:hypothetical protein